MMDGDSDGSYEMALGYPINIPSPIASTRLPCIYSSPAASKGRQERKDTRSKKKKKTDPAMLKRPLKADGIVIKKPFQQILGKKIATVEKYARVYLNPSCPHVIDESLELESVREHKLHARDVKTTKSKKRQEVASYMTRWEQDRSINMALELLVKKENETRKLLREEARTAKLPIIAYFERLNVRCVVRYERKIRAEIRKERGKERYLQFMQIVEQLASQEDSRRRYHLTEYMHSHLSLQRIEYKSTEHVIRLDLELDYRRNLYALKREFLIQTERVKQYIIDKAAWESQKEHNRNALYLTEDAHRKSLVEDSKRAHTTILKSKAMEKDDIVQEQQRREEARVAELKRLHELFVSECTKHATAEQTARCEIISTEAKQRKGFKADALASKNAAKLALEHRIEEFIRNKEIRHAEERDTVKQEEDDGRGRIDAAEERRRIALVKWFERQSEECLKPLRVVCHAADLSGEWDSDMEDPEDEASRRTWWRRQVSREGVNITTVAAPKYPVGLPLYLVGGKMVSIFPDVVVKCEVNTPPLTGECRITVKLTEGTGSEAVVCNVYTVEDTYCDAASKVKHIKNDGIYLVDNAKVQKLSSDIPLFDPERRVLECTMDFGCTAVLKDWFASTFQGIGDFLGTLYLTTHERPCESRPRILHVMLTMAYAVVDMPAIELQVPLSVVITPPLFSMPQKHSIALKLGDKANLALFSELQVNEHHADLCLGRLLRGAKLTVKITEGYSEGDALVLGSNVRIQGGVFSVGDTPVCKVPDPQLSPFINPVAANQKRCTYTVVAANLARFGVPRRSIADVIKGSRPLEALCSFIQSIRFTTTSLSRPHRVVSVMFSDLSGQLVTSSSSIVCCQGSEQSEKLFAELPHSSPAISRLNAVCHPRNVDSFLPWCTPLVPSYEIQSTDLETDSLQEGEMTVTLTNSTSGDVLLLAADEVVQVHEGKITYHDTVLGKVVVSDVGTFETVESTNKGTHLKIRLSPDVKLLHLRNTVRKLRYRGQEECKKTSNKVVNVTVSTGGRNLTVKQTIKILPPLFDIAPHYLHQEYKEGQGAKKVALFETDCGEAPEDHIATGYISVEVVNGKEEDQLRLASYNSCDYTITNVVGKGVICSSITDKQLGWFFKAQQGTSKLVIHIETKKGQSPVSIKRDILSVLRGITYENISKNPVELKKLLRFTLASESSGCSQTLLNYSINTVNDPTVINLAYNEVKYAPNTKGREWGCLIAEGVTMSDPDTDTLSPGSYFSVELTSGGGLGSGDTFSMISPEMQAVFYPDSPFRLVYDSEAGRLVVNNTNATVVVKEERSIIVRFGGGTESLSIEGAAYVLSCIAFGTFGAPIKTGWRQFTIRFNAGDQPVIDTKVRSSVEVLPPLLYAPIVTLNACYKEGSTLALNTKVASPRIPSQASLAGSVAWAEILSGYDGTQDELLFIPSKEFVLRDETIFIAGGSKLGKLTVSQKKLVMHFDEKGRSNGGKLHGLLKCFHYRNTSRAPDVHQRFVEIGLTWNNETSAITVVLDVQSIDDMTEVVLARQQRFYVADTSPIYIFENASVTDEDTDMFEAPHSFVKVDISSSQGYEMLSFDESVVNVDDGTGNVCIGGEHIGRMTTRKGGFTVDLEQCHISLLQLFIRSVTFRTRQMRAGRGHNKTIHLQVKGGPTVPPTRVSISVDICPPFIDIPRDKAERPITVEPGESLHVTESTGIRFTGPMWFMQLAPYCITCMVEGTKELLVGMVSVCNA